MSWTCPNQIKDNFCSLRKKECQTGADGCVLAGKLKFIGDEDSPGPDKDTEKQGEKKSSKN